MKIPFPCAGTVENLLGAYLIILEKNDYV